MKVVKLTATGKVAVAICIVCMVFGAIFTFTKWENANADVPDYSAASAAEYLGVSEEDVVRFPYEVGGKTLDGYAVQTHAGIQVAIPDFSRQDGDDWKWDWLKDTTLTDVVLEAMKINK